MSNTARPAEALSPDVPQTARRTLLCGAALAALGLGSAACGGADSEDEASAGPSSSTDLGPADAVPVGEAKLYAGEQVFVSQPKKDEFRAFSAICTHQGGKINTVQDGAAECPLHGSRFDVRSGKVMQGPATEPLPEVPVQVNAKGRLVTQPDKAK